MSHDVARLPVEDPRRQDRVRNRTPAPVLARIDRRTATRAFDAARGGPDAILARISELDREWDLERYLALNFSVLAAIAEQKGRTHRGWRALFRAQQVFLGMHALVGWCPPTSLLRRLGVRTQKEIDAERVLLIELYRLLATDDELAGDPDFDPDLGADLEIIEEAAVLYEPETDTSAGTPLRW